MQIRDRYYEANGMKSFSDHLKYQVKKVEDAIVSIMYMSPIKLSKKMITPSVFLISSMMSPSLAVPAHMRTHVVWGLTQASVVQEECN